MGLLYTEFKLRGTTLRNRLVMSPMCMYSSQNGYVSDWHMVHYPSRAVGGAGLIILEATAVEERGRISPLDLGIYRDEHTEGLSRLCKLCKEFGAKVGIQLAHAGRKAESYPPWERDKVKVRGTKDAIAPSSIPFGKNWLPPREATLEDIKEIQNSYRLAFKRAVEAGFDLIEIHAAHGYLIHEFLSPLTNKREDSYGGSFENRVRFLIEVVRIARKEIPDNIPLSVRISAVDYVEGGWTLEESIELVKLLKEEGVDLIDCSSGRISEEEGFVEYPGHQVPFAEEIRKKTDARTMAVGVIRTYEQAEEIISNGRADLVAIGREFLRDPYLPLRWAKQAGLKPEVPRQYIRAW
ncbi:2,4-dienoyl-CoA reductase-like NADH-dependent reductase (Old Yellow Enzyme family) [Hydrogenivirga caldilitoris]|uniref:2,4-dienoyl-CoA reductase-like NADH-dependent reductase (Old Yellow Enzyme family) n=1 Tax=Hydrogenivirga caldilitoris TaxID=246264 RepID=A0A497XQG3_9AQUI|nr:NADH:flavin oxidoreductase/NADH oxidase [Hydrogenivirga caldilitoris]RLJ70521.1 2,4-dienoyl-CoA reductase-like NADH-dependent reductase (Old Yellow Enzyme family) [Hydrogenivirga caldilitoris]